MTDSSFRSVTSESHEKHPLGGNNEVPEVSFPLVREEPLTASSVDHSSSSNFSEHQSSKVTPSPGFPHSST